jgi:hypothetical protein
MGFGGWWWEEKVGREGKVKFALRAHALTMWTTGFALRFVPCMNLSANLEVHIVGACALRGKKTAYLIIIV